MSHSESNEMVYGDATNRETAKLSLEEFMDRWGALFERSMDDEAAQLAMAGVLEGEAIAIDVMKSFNLHMRPTLSDSRIQIHRDYDSLIGMSKTLPYSKPLDIFCVSPNSFALTADNHMNYETVRSQNKVPHNLYII